MPELPEVETMRRGVAHLAGRHIEGVQVVDGPCRPIEIAPKLVTFRRRVVGHEVVAFERWGKRVVARLDDQQTIVFEPRMTGLVLVAEPPDQDHLRFVLELGPKHDNRMSVRRTRAGGRPSERLMFWDRRGLGSVQLFGAGEIEARLGPAHLGPDALQLTAKIMQERLGARRRALKVALMDQRLIAGIGNLYASEILHVAGCDPAKRCDRMRLPEWQRVCEAVHSVLLEAIRYEGSTLSDGTYRNALNQDGGYQNHHRVYDRADQPCGRCKSTTIRRIVQSQRSTFYCPGCQR